jgi:hypothetical protein
MDPPDILEEYVFKRDDAAVHFSSEGGMAPSIHPQTRHGTPKGICSYPLTKRMWKKYFASNDFRVPFRDHLEWMHILVPDTSGEVVHIDSNGNAGWTERQMVQKLDVLYQSYHDLFLQGLKGYGGSTPPGDHVSEVLDRKPFKRFLEYPPYDTPFSRFWYITDKLAMTYGNGEPQWTNMLLEVGVHVAFDYGSATLHSNEPTQAIFFKPGGIQVLDTVPNIYDWREEEESSDIEQKGVQFRETLDLTGSIFENNVLPDIVASVYPNIIEIQEPGDEHIREAEERMRDISQAIESIPNGKEYLDSMDINLRALTPGEPLIKERGGDIIIGDDITMEGVEVKAGFFQRFLISDAAVTFKQCEIDNNVWDPSLPESTEMTFKGCSLEVDRSALVKAYEKRRDEFEETVEEDVPPDKFVRDAAKYHLEGQRIVNIHTRDLVSEIIGDVIGGSLRFVHDNDVRLV